MSEIQKMNAAVGALPPLLFVPTTRRIPPGLEGMEINEMRKKARAWVGPDLSRLPRHSLVMTLRQALEDDNVADRILRALPPQELAVAAVYRRYGGSVDGEVIRLELMARGLLEIIEEKTPYHTAKKWKSNPIRALTESWVLISERPDMGYYFSPYYTHGPEHSFERYSLHAGMVRSIKPAGPPPWSIPTAEGVPQADTIAGRSAAEVALDLSRAFAYLSAHGSVKVRKNGLLATPVLRAMEKAVPLDKGSDFRLPDPHGFLFELLRHGGCGPDRSGRGIGRSRRDDAADRPVRPLAGAPLGARLAIDARLVRRLWNADGQRTRALRNKRMEQPADPGLGAGLPGPCRRSLV